MTTTNKIVKKEFGELMETLTPKQAKFFDLWLKTGNGTKAALEVYETKDPKAASVIATENLAKLRNPMKTFLENSGIGATHVVKVVLDAMQAEKTDITGDKHPDHRVRLEATDRLSRWLDLEPKETNTTLVQVNNINAQDFFDQ